MKLICSLLTKDIDGSEDGARPHPQKRSSRESKPSVVPQIPMLSVLPKPADVSPFGATFEYHNSQAPTPASILASTPSANSVDSFIDLSPRKSHTPLPTTSANTIDDIQEVVVRRQNESETDFNFRTLLAQLHNTNPNANTANIVRPSLKPGIKILHLLSYAPTGNPLFDGSRNPLLTDGPFFALLLLALIWKQLQQHGVMDVWPRVTKIATDEKGRRRGLPKFQSWSTDASVLLDYTVTQLNAVLRDSVNHIVVYGQRVREWFDASRHLLKVSSVQIHYMPHPESLSEMMPISRELLITRYEEAITQFKQLGHLLQTEVDTSHLETSAHKLRCIVDLKNSASGRLMEAALAAAMHYNAPVIKVEPDCEMPATVASELPPTPPSVENRSPTNASEMIPTRLVGRDCLCGCHEKVTFKQEMNHRLAEGPRATHPVSPRLCVCGCGDIVTCAVETRHRGHNVPLSRNCLCGCSQAVSFETENAHRLAKGPNQKRTPSSNRSITRLCLCGCKKVIISATEEIHIRRKETWINAPISRDCLCGCNNDVSFGEERTHRLNKCFFSPEKVYENHALVFFRLCLCGCKKFVTAVTETEHCREPVEPATTIHYSANQAATF